MKVKFNQFNFFLFAALSIFIFGFAQAETITLTTFYPSPIGVYKDLESEGLKVDSLTIRPQEQLPLNPSEGMLFHSNGKVIDSKGNTLARGIWLYVAEKWFPVTIFHEPD